MERTAANAAWEELCFSHPSALRCARPYALGRMQHMQHAKSPRTTKARKLSGALPLSRQNQQSKPFQRPRSVRYQARGVSRSVSACAAGPQGCRKTQM